MLVFATLEREFTMGNINNWCKTYNEVGFNMNVQTNRRF